MLYNYLITAWRNLLRNKLYSVINILGLAVAMTAAVIIFQYVFFHFSFDRFHEKKDRIYKVNLLYRWTDNGQRYSSMNSFNHRNIPVEIKNDFPEVEDFARIIPNTMFRQTDLFDNNDIILKYINDNDTEIIFRENGVIMADASIFNVFTYPLLKGDPRTALIEPNTITLSEKVVKKIFAEKNAMGKILLVNNIPMKISGVFKEIPSNSYLQFDYIISYNTIPAKEREAIEKRAWFYILVSPGADH